MVNLVSFGFETAIKLLRRDKTSNVPATLDTARYAPPWKITKHNSQHQSYVSCMNQRKIRHIKLKMTFSKINLVGF